MDITTLSLGPAQLKTLRILVQFHLDNDQPDDENYDRRALIELAEKIGADVPAYEVSR